MNARASAARWKPPAWAAAYYAEEHRRPEIDAEALRRMLLARRAWSALPSDARRDVLAMITGAAVTLGRRRGDQDSEQHLALVGSLRRARHAAARLSTDLQMAISMTTGVNARRLRSLADAVEKCSAAIRPSDRDARSLLIGRASWAMKHSTGKYRDDVVAELLSAYLDATITTDAVKQLRARRRAR